MSRPLSIRVDDDTYREVERRRIEAGQSRTEWLRGLVDAELSKPFTVKPPDSAAVQFCAHPQSKRLGSVCVSCGQDLVAC